jgi:hypothetical protein
MAHLQLAVRINPNNPKHHLFNNHGTWWCHFSVIENNHTQRRVRVNLRTDNILQALSRGDQRLGSESRTLASVAFNLKLESAL